MQQCKQGNQQRHEQARLYFIFTHQGASWEGAKGAGSVQQMEVEMEEEVEVEVEE